MKASGMEEEEITPIRIKVDILWLQSAISWSIWQKHASTFTASYAVEWALWQYATGEKFWYLSVCQERNRFMKVIKVLHDCSKTTSWLICAEKEVLCDNDWNKQAKQITCKYPLFTPLIFPIHTYPCTLQPLTILSRDPHWHHPFLHLYLDPTGVKNESQNCFVQTMYHTSLGKHPSILFFERS